MGERFRTFRRGYWAVVPLLAIIAYATTLRTGFLSDDFLLMYTARRGGINLGVWLPDPGWIFYRPIGTMLTWQVGWQFWGFNPFPYHLISLLLHAGVSLLLGLWLATATSNRPLGWLAGAFFAVFPLNIEAVGWLAAQWDVLAALFVLLALWVFTLWYRRGRGGGHWHLYVFSLLSYTFGVFTKESALTFLLVFPLSTWLVKGQMARRDWGKLSLLMLPFCIPLLLNIGLRLATWGNLGGYTNLRGSYFEQFWDGLIAHAHMLLAPINTAVLGNTTAQVVGGASSLLILAGLVLYGYRYRRLLFVAGAWVVLAALPTLNFPVKLADLENNRYLYLPAAGYCVGIAVLLYAIVLSLRRWRLPALSALGILLLVCVAATWAQLRPWHTATAQAEAVEAELLNLIPLPPQPRVEPMVWYVQDAPDNYQGAYIYRQGLGVWRDFTTQDGPAVQRVSDSAHANIAADKGDAFALSFVYDTTEMRFHITYGIGITAASEPPTQSIGPASSYTWDFRDCTPALLQSWQAINAQTQCAKGSGLLVHPLNADPQIFLPSLNPPLEVGGVGYVRLLLSATYPPTTEQNEQTNQWFWRGSTTDWGSERTRTLPIKRDGVAHTYWTFIPANKAGDITGLRLDTVNGNTNATIHWIAISPIGK